MTDLAQSPMLELLSRMVLKDGVGIGSSSRQKHQAAKLTPRQTCQNAA